MEIRERIAELAATGLTGKGIADALGISRNAVMGHVYRGKIVLLTPPNGPVDDAEFAKYRTTVLEMRAAGHSVQEISAQTGKHTSSIRRLLAKANIPSPIKARPVLPRKPSKPRVPRQSHIAPPTAEAGGVILEALMNGQCKFPVNDAPRGGTHLFCGEVVSGTFGLGRSYCAKHAARAIAPRQPKPMNKPIAIPARAFR